jgi:CheY-like chemotaxis protein
MQMIDRDIATSSALVIDPNLTSRGMLASQLRDFGVGNVSQSSRIHDARRMLESRTFDIVLCEQEFEAEGYSGQNLLDDLRRLQLLPLSTVFIIVTGSASYTTVADAAESAVDSFLLKPYTAAALGERLTQVRKRKKSLADIFAPVAAGDLASAARLCLKRFKEQGPFSAYAARLGCELLLRIGEPEAAKRLNELVLETDPTVPWARLGVARAQIDANQPAAAARSLETLVAEQPNYTDALDVLGRLQVEQGDINGAVATYRRAAEFTRGSIVRLQRHGLTAYYAGLRDEAQKPLERAAVLGLGSRMFDMQVLVLLTALRYEQRDGRALQRALDSLQEAAAKDPDNTRLAALGSVAWVFGLAFHKQFDQVGTELASWSARLLDPALDTETACNLLTLWSTLTASGVPMPDDTGAWIDTLATRFASSRATTELLAGAAGIHPPFAQRVRQAQQAVSMMAERAVAHTLEGHHQTAIAELIDEGERTLNMKLVDLARMTLQRHREKVQEAAALAAAIDRMRVAAAGASQLPPLGQTSREGAVLRARAADRRA